MVGIIRKGWSGGCQRRRAHRSDWRVGASRVAGPTRSGLDGHRQPHPAPADLRCHDGRPARRIGTVWCAHRANRPGERRRPRDQHNGYDCHRRHRIVGRHQPCIRISPAYFTTARSSAAASNRRERSRRSHHGCRRRRNGHSTRPDSSWCSRAELQRRLVIRLDPPELLCGRRRGRLGRCTCWSSSPSSSAQNPYSWSTGTRCRCPLSSASRLATSPRQRRRQTSRRQSSQTGGSQSRHRPSRSGRRPTRHRAPTAMPMPRPTTRHPILRSPIAQGRRHRRRNRRLLRCQRRRGPPTTAPILLRPTPRLERSREHRASDRHVLPGSPRDLGISSHG